MQARFCVLTSIMLAIFSLQSASLAQEVSKSECSDPNAVRAAANAAPNSRLVPNQDTIEQALNRINKFGCPSHNRKTIAIVDFDFFSGKSRMWLVNLINGRGISNPIYVAHGKGSDPENTGYATAFGNIPSSKMSSLGYFKGEDVYYGKHGLSVRLNGLESSNNNARQRFVVIHTTASGGANYVSYAWLKKNHKLGRSYGCFVVMSKDFNRIRSVVADGGILFAGSSRHTAQH